jgi:hypothetical protein
MPYCSPRSAASPHRACKLHGTHHFGEGGFTPFGLRST